ncbi:MAG: trimeric intracellular cation channel family protein [Lachnospiraceae bacterium]|jgi:uncharacterized membrane protein YeiH|nr:trimeric intracellular cation channel family protein [Lachnospiraceae bacterium]
MLSNITVFLAIELIGTAAFACSGGMVAIRKHLDLLGIVVLGVTTAVGGGMLRDLIIGIHPPTLFVKPIYVWVAFLSVLVLFFIVRFCRITMEILESEIYERVMNLLDAIGLGAFTVVGIDTAIEAGLGEYRFLMIFLGTITGVGGGILRDMMAGETPAVLKKHVYACASIAGAVCYVGLLEIIGNDLSMVMSALLVVIIRILARKYRWNLPRAM